MISGIAGVCTSPKTVTRASLKWGTVKPDRAALAGGKTRGARRITYFGDAAMTVFGDMLSGSLTYNYK